MAKEIIRHTGFSIAKLAKVFKVHRDTIYDWMGEYPDFSDGVRQGRKIFDGVAIERCLVKRALGYRFTETTRERSTGGEMVVTKKVSKFVPPDIASIKHWQVNMDQANWADKQRLVINQKTELEISDEDRRIAKEFSSAFAKEAFEKLKEG